MARDFVRASTQYLEHAALLASPPFTVAAWVRPDDQTFSTIVAVGRSGAAAHWHYLGHDSAVYASSRDGGTERFDTAAGTISAGAWSHVAGVWASSTSRIAYLAAGAGPGDTNSVSPVSLDRTTIGARNSAGSIVFPFDGLIAEVGLWDAALTDSEIAILNKAYSPLFVRPQNLIAYWPILGRTSPEIDPVGAADMTVTGASVADHPRVFLPAPRLGFHRTPAVGGSITPHMMHYARQRRVA